MPSWWGKSWSKEEKKKKSKESFIDTLHKKFKSPESKPSGRLGGSRRRSNDIVSERGSQSQAVSRSPSPSKHVARCQSFAERPQAQPLPLPGMRLRTANVRRTDSGIRESAKPKLERVSKLSLFPPLRRPTCIWQKPDPADMDGEVIGHSISSECSVESDDPADSHQRSPLATDYDVGSRTAAGSPSSFVRDQPSVTLAISRESPVTVNLSAKKTVSSPHKRQPLSSRVPNLHVPQYGAFFSAPDSSMSSPSRSPMRISGYEQVFGSAFPAGKLFPDTSYSDLINAQVLDQARLLVIIQWEEICQASYSGSPAEEARKIPLTQVLEWQVLALVLEFRVVL